jgi:hypothetical protein
VARKPSDRESRWVEEEMVEANEVRSEARVTLRGGGEGEDSEEEEGAAEEENGGEV